MGMSKVYQFIVSARELYLDSVGTDSRKCRCRLKRPANVDRYFDGDSSSTCRPDMFDICTNPYLQRQQHQCINWQRPPKTRHAATAPPSQSARIGTPQSYSSTQFLCPLADATYWKRGGGEGAPPIWSMRQRSSVFHQAPLAVSQACMHASPPLPSAL